MENPVLKNKPLVEAIFELHWELKSIVPNIANNVMTPLQDPHYRRLIGRFENAVHEKYPIYEQLPTANVPEELVSYTAQHRFRSEENQWPLIQLGPGVLTLNSTKDYKWESFCPRVIEAIGLLKKAYPKTEDLKIQRFMLHYVDAVKFSIEESNAYNFLKENLKLGFDIPSSLFLENHVKTNPIGLQWQSAFQCLQPKGTFVLRVANGLVDNDPALIWETIVESQGADVPSQETYSVWLSAAHELASHCFFNMIEGQLERRFSGE